MFRRKKNKKNAERRSDSTEHKAYNDVLSDRLSKIGDYTHDYDESERQEVEARIRRMFYGAKVEGSLAERAAEGRQEVEADEYGSSSHG